MGYEEEAYGKKPQVDENLRDHARATLKDCKNRLHAFQNEWADAWSGHMNRTFDYYRSILNEDSTCTDWVKDGVALLIRCYGTGKDLCESTHKLCTPKDSTPPAPATPAAPPRRE